MAHVAGVLLLTAVVVGTAEGGVLSTLEGRPATNLRTDVTAADSTRVLAENSLWTPVDGERVAAFLHMGTTTWHVTGLLPMTSDVPVDTARQVRVASNAGKLFKVSQTVRITDVAQASSSQI